MLLAAAILGLFVLYLFSNSLILVGTWLEGKMGGAGFIGRFIADLGDILGMLLTVVSALIGAGLTSRIAGSHRAGHHPAAAGSRDQSDRICCSPPRRAHCCAILIMLALNWFYQFDNPAVIYYWPGAIGTADRRADCGALESQG